MTLGHQTIKPMWWFVLRYSFWAPFLFALIYFEKFSPLIIINHLQSDLSIYLTQLWINATKVPIQMFGATLIFTNGLKLEIVNECNGLAAFLLLLAAIIAYPAPKKNKFFWVIFSYIFLVAANSIRLDSIAYHMIEHPENFKFVHEVVGRYIFTMITLLLFYFFSNRSISCQPTSFFNDRC